MSEKPYQKLILQLEQATEGSRELWLDVVKHALKHGWIDQKRAEHNAGLIHIAFKSGFHDVLVAVALSLVPEGWWWSITASLYSSNRAVARTGSCEDTISHMGETVRSGPALALCIAAIKAKVT